MLSSPFRLKIKKVRAWRAGAFVREGPVFLLSAHQFFGGKECAQGLKKGPGARGARVTDLSWANLEALLSSCHLQSQGIKGGGAGREGPSGRTPNLGRGWGQRDIKEIAPEDRQTLL